MEWLNQEAEEFERKFEQIAAGLVREIVRTGVGVVEVTRDGIRVVGGSDGVA